MDACVYPGCGNNYIQPTKLFLVVTKALSQQPFQSIAVRGAPDLFSGDCQTQARVTQPVSSGNHQKFFICGAIGGSENLLKFRRVCQPVLSGKNASRPEHGRY